eukprot:CAMPEP_0184709598 /NCGR_PEP_ID=MMETSP0314-20130426/704_1 /TAXON_ID=38298 /ORGANISM="Rhodella maculata, Strain CCMP 736" /LENGTH=102 /DNA_ID=CAMNT_0027171323 /DNA_START=112 /DNA_END=420 /DNA_ORIENTATION=-
MNATDFPLELFLTPTPSAAALPPCPSPSTIDIHTHAASAPCRSRGTKKEEIKKMKNKQFAKESRDRARRNMAELRERQRKLMAENVALQDFLRKCNEMGKLN